MQEGASRVGAAPLTVALGAATMAAEEVVIRMDTLFQEAIQIRKGEAGMHTLCCLPPQCCSIRNGVDCRVYTLHLSLVFM